MLNTVFFWVIAFDGSSSLLKEQVKCELRHQQIEIILEVDKGNPIIDVTTSMDDRFRWQASGGTALFSLNKDAFPVVVEDSKSTSKLIINKRCLIEVIKKPSHSHKEKEDFQ
ncbi:hypothetical protein [Vibrio sp. McD22-P3]|uniref:hypothetical protein n=1 Tax=Vibrio sp. McD22-P3 TaxID=2724880 RepID=UPI001F23899C|nr:hypothetical protein [Vibrio sp. McD22-P3]MCF4172913.1 hypothetical protein [Vibrio sp. McD22-P3]